MERDKINKPTDKYKIAIFEKCNEEKKYMWDNDREYFCWGHPRAGSLEAEHEVGTFVPVTEGALSAEACEGERSAGQGRGRSWAKDLRVQGNSSLHMKLRRDQ